MSSSSLVSFWWGNCTTVYEIAPNQKFILGNEVVHIYSILHSTHGIIAEQNVESPQEV